MSYQQERQAATEAVTKAAGLCTQVRTDMVDLNALEKGDKSPVTIADFGAQALVCQHLKAAFPNDAIVGEEDASDLRIEANAEQLASVAAYVQKYHPQATPDEICDWIDAGNALVAERFWTLDPIDGTKGFLRNDQYAIALALIEDGEVKVAALACPALSTSLDVLDAPTGSLFVAVRGEGTKMTLLSSDTFEPIQVSQGSSANGARFVESVEAGHGNHALQEAIARAAGITQPSLRMDSQAKYGAVARGDAALYLRLPSPKYPNYVEKIWDHAAGSLVVEEAGGRVTDMHGKPLDFVSDYKMNDNQGVVVSAGPFHEAVIEALANN
ncbi:3'(2'),5'-bisphosphate nucleotidase [Chloroflexi bacterium TSY]|nr:3'(2'),5'-bisphosphate nucleotidase [Chloroflexi bacterium TSY]